jgi:hypothetical protein
MAQEAMTEPSRLPVFGFAELSKASAVEEDWKNDHSGILVGHSQQFLLNT